MIRFLAAFVLALAVPRLFAAQPAGKPPEFQTEIAPIFQQLCVKCHGGDMVMGKLRLDSEAAILRGGVSGPAVVPGNSAQSLLVKRILGLTDAPRMPMGGDPLPPEKVQLLRSWVDHLGVDHRNFAASEASASAGNSASSQSAPANGQQSSLFATTIRPILAARCYSCHGPDVQQNGLRLDSLPAILRGSDFGKVIVPGQSGKSRLIRRLMAQERPQMPYGGPPLSEDQIGAIRRWIDAGAPGPDSTTPTAASQHLKHWAYVRPVPPPLPQVQNVAWCRNPIDNFVLAKLEKEG